MKTMWLFIGLLASCIASAQPTFTPGVRGGVNFAKISDTDLGFKTDYYAGVFAGVQFNKTYTLQPEINYSRQGAKGDYDYYDGFDNQVRNVDISLQYLSIGIMNKFTFVDRLSIIVGPSVDILVNNSPNVRTQNDGDFALTGGIGCRIVDGLGVEFRVKKGFVTAISDSEFTDSTAFFEVDQASNLVLQLGLTYTFTVK